MMDSLFVSMQLTYLSGAFVDHQLCIDFCIQKPRVKSHKNIKQLLIYSMQHPYGAITYLNSDRSQLAGNWDWIFCHYVMWS